MLTVERQERERELDPGEDGEEQEVRRPECLQLREPLAGRRLRRTLWRGFGQRRLLGAAVRSLLGRGGVVEMALPTRLRQGNGQENRLRDEEHQADDGRDRVYVELPTGSGEARRERLRGEVRADGRPDAEADRKGDADVGERFTARSRTSDVG